MNSTGRTGFGLHFNDLKRFAEHVFHTFGRPGIGIFSHIGGRGDGIDCRHFAECVGDIRRGMIAVNGLHLFAHCLSFFLFIS